MPYGDNVTLILPFIFIKLSMKVFDEYLRGQILYDNKLDIFIKLRVGNNIIDIILYNR